MLPRGIENLGSIANLPTDNGGTTSPSINYARGTVIEKLASELPEEA